MGRFQGLGERPFMLGVIVDKLLAFRWFWHATWLPKGSSFPLHGWLPKSSVGPTHGAKLSGTCKGKPSSTCTKFRNSRSVCFQHGDLCDPIGAQQPQGLPLRIVVGLGIWFQGFRPVMARKVLVSESYICSLRLPRPKVIDPSALRASCLLDPATL